MSILLSKWAIEFPVLTITFFITIIFSHFFFFLLFLLVSKILPYPIEGIFYTYFKADSVRLIKSASFAVQFPFVVFLCECRCTVVFSLWFTLPWEYRFPWLTAGIWTKGGKLRSLLMPLLLSFGNKQCANNILMGSTIFYLLPSSQKSNTAPQGKLPPVFKITINISWAPSMCQSNVGTRSSLFITSPPITSPLTTTHTRHTGTQSHPVFPESFYFFFFFCHVVRYMKLVYVISLEMVQWRQPASHIRSY